MRKKIAICISIILVVALVILLGQYEKREKEIEDVYIAMSQETSPFSQQVHELEKQIYELKSNASEVQTKTATTQFLITDLSINSYEQIIEPMSVYPYPVAIGLSLRKMPGQEGCMTTEQAETLVAQGWYFCYVFQAEEADDLSLWIEEVRSSAMEQGLNMENAIYFPSGTYKEEFVDVLKEQGIQTVIHQGELGNGLLTAAKEDELWYVGSAWWRGNEILDNKLAKISQNGGELVTIMGIDDSAKNSLQDWMSQFEGILNQSSIEVTDFSDMEVIQEDNERKGVEEAEDYQRQVEELNEQIEELNQQIDEIENRYNEKARRLRK